MHLHTYQRVWRRFVGSRRQLAALCALLTVFAVANAPWRFCTLYYDYIPADQLAAELLESVPPPPPGALPACPPPRTQPWPVAVDLSPVADDQLAALAVTAPRHCTPRYRVAVVVPYRARAAQLRLLLRHLHPLLRAQRLDYRIYVIEQTHRFPFNRGKLLNVGFAEAAAETGADCVVFHDVDLLAEDAANVYACSRRPRHLSARVSTMRYQLPYATLAGGVLAVPADTFRRVNGYSNLYFGWGAEDDDFAGRLAAVGEALTRPDPRVSRFTMVSHARQTPSGDRLHLLAGAVGRAAVDGLNSLRYTVLAREDRHTHRWVKVEV